MIKMLTSTSVFHDPAVTTLSDVTSPNAEP